MGLVAHNLSEWIISLKTLKIPPPPQQSSKCIFHHHSLIKIHTPKLHNSTPKIPLEIINQQIEKGRTEKPINQRKRERERERERKTK